MISNKDQKPLLCTLHDDARLGLFVFFAIASNTCHKFSPTHTLTDTHAEAQIHDEHL